MLEIGRFYTGNIAYYSPNEYGHHYGTIRELVEAAKKDLPELDPDKDFIIEIFNYDNGRCNIKNGFIVLRIDPDGGRYHSFKNDPRFKPLYY
jgi:hypothetical protein